MTDDMTPAGAEGPVPPPPVDSMRCGFVAVIGAPNAGKSTLVNTLVGAKVSIVSPKVQTTRTIVRGITVYGDSQIIFVDTPGIFKAGKRFERAMVSAAWMGEAEAELVMLVVDAAKKGGIDEARPIIEKLSAAGAGKNIALVLNKIDRVEPERLMKLAAEFNAILPFSATFMVSALKEKGTEDILKYLARTVPAGMWMYPEDQMSDMPIRLLAADVTREKLFLRLHQELPYALTVETESWEEFRDGSARIDQVIYVAKESYRPMILGKGGSLIRTIGEQSRRDLEEMLERRVHLKLFVKVNERWVDDPERYRAWGLDFEV